jgi:hypothetical protein
MTQYFGFFGNGYVNWGDLIDRTASYSNLNWIQPCPEMIEQLVRSKAYGQKVIIACPATFFAPPNFTPVQNFRQNFYDWWLLIPEDLKSTIVAILIADEPFRQNFKNMKTPLSTERLIANLDGISNWIKGAIGAQSGVATMISASGTEYDQYGAPKEIDWLGMYRYSYNTNWMQLAFSFWNLVRMKKPEQQIVAIVDAYADDEHPIDESRIKRYNEYWKTYVNIYSKHVVAVCPFLYQSTVMNGKNVWGAESMPRVLAELQGWGLKFPRTTEVA